MPKDASLHTILLIGSGPIVIGQGCEFDYSGVQACKALKEEGYRVVLVNSNPATIMTDPEFADRTYIEPITTEVIEKIIEKERPDALLPTLGGQTGLNASMDLHRRGILAKHGVKMIGANAEAIEKGEDRLLFKEAMLRIGLDVPRSGAAHSLDEAWKIAEEIGGFPLIIRPAFTLGGSGGGIARNRDEYETMVRFGLQQSPVNEVLVEESLLGWKEFEIEVMRDCADNCVVICSIENLDPMGVHTGDSITVAPIQTLTDREYQHMRDASFAVIREIGVETGGSNIQFAVHPQTGRMVIIEMNPRVSRSSALASKATGFPIAKIAAKLAVGYTLDELPNDITRETPASFEPTIDYVVTKLPRFTFEKFPAAKDMLTTQMKSVGEAMAIGRTFKESLQKALRSLETGRFGLGADGKDKPIPEGKTLEELLRVPNSERIFYLRTAFQSGMTVSQIQELTQIDPWFLRQIEEIVQEEKRLAAVLREELTSSDLRRAKKMGFSDRQIAKLSGRPEDEIRALRKAAGIVPTYRLVDTCAAEFEAYTPYYYSTYGIEDESRAGEKRKIMILGGGPNRIGQGIEFDYCCVHAAFALREMGFETIMVNSNPETVSTDYDTSDRLFFEPLTLEDTLNIYESQKCWGAIVQFGGQTPLNLAAQLERHGVNIIGTTPRSIELAEDRKHFSALLDRLGLEQAPGGTAVSEEEAVDIAHRIGFPVLVRPSFVLGGRAMMIVYNDHDLRNYMRRATEVSPDRPVLIDHFLENALEIDVDLISDGKTTVIGAIMEHIEEAGIHSGDSACAIPSFTLNETTEAAIRTAAHQLAEALDVCGLMNIQFAAKENQLYVLEVNPRASRTIPFVSKTIGVPLAKYAAMIMTRETTLVDLGFTKEIIPPHHAVKEAVFPFVKFPGVDILLGPEMKSTGEVMGIDSSLSMAFAKSQMAASSSLPTKGNLFLSVKEAHKAVIGEIAREFADLGFAIYATEGTAAAVESAGVPVHRLKKLREGSPNVVDLVQNGEIHLLINTPEGRDPRQDEVAIRSFAAANRVPIMTTLRAVRASLLAIRALKDNVVQVCPLQDYHPE